MEKVFPVVMEALGVPSGYLDGKNTYSPSGFKEGIVERILGQGRFIVILGDGVRVQVSGPENLRPGSRVRVPVQRTLGKVLGNASTSSNGVTLSPEGFAQWGALLPLAFGGKGAIARLEVFGDRSRKTFSGKNNLAVYFIFTVSTEKNGEITWGIHLRGKEIALQVYFSNRAGKSSEKFLTLVSEVENLLKKAGFLMPAPTIFLTKPIRVPFGFHLSTKG